MTLDGYLSTFKLLYFLFVDAPLYNKVGLQSIPGDEPY